MAMPKTLAPSAGKLCLADLINLVLTLTPGVVAWGMTILFLRAMWESSFLLLMIFASPLVSCAVFMATLFSLRCLLPRVEPGEYAMGFNWGMFAWSCSHALAKAAAVSGLSPLIHSSYVLKFLYWRALGARIAFRVATASDVTLADLPLIAIGSGTTLAEGVQVLGHRWMGDKLVLAQVTLGRNVSVGAGAELHLGTMVSDDVRVGAGNRLYGDLIKRGTQIADYEWEHGNPNHKLQTAVTRQQGSTIPAEV